MSEPSTPEAESTPDAPEAKQETFGLDYVKSLRDEAAAARIAKKEAVEAAKAEVIKEYEGKLAEKDTAFSELQTAHTEATTELLKLKAVVTAKIPVEDIEDVVSLVQGSDEESVSESVSRVKALLGKTPAKVPAVDSTQGKGGAIPLNGNPVLDMLKAAVNAR